MTAHMLQGGPLDGVVAMTPKHDHYPAELRIPDNGLHPIVIHVYGLNRGHSANPTRPARPTYHYSHTVTI